MLLPIKCHRLDNPEVIIALCIPLCPLTQLPLRNVSAYVVLMPTEYLAEELESHFLYIKKHSSDGICHQLMHVDRE